MKLLREEFKAMKQVIKTKEDGAYMSKTVQNRMQSDITEFFSAY